MTKKIVTLSLINPLTVVMFFTFFFCKAFGLIDWSWIWVFAPLWILSAIALSVIIIIGILYLTLLILEVLWK